MRSQEWLLTWPRLQQVAGAGPSRRHLSLQPPAGGFIFRQWPTAA